MNLYIKNSLSRSLRASYIQQSKSSDGDYNPDSLSHLGPNANFQRCGYFLQPKRPGTESSKRGDGNIWLRQGIDIYENGYAHNA